MPSIDDLSAAAQKAYRAFLDMSDSKDAHFNYLQAIETKYRSGGAPSPAENAELEKLLAKHDRNVLAFKTAMADVSDSGELKNLVRLMS